MMGRKRFAPRLYHGLSLEALMPEDHLLRRLESVVSLSFVRKLCAPYYSHTGQPSVDPVVLFKMMLLGYLYGITSERRLAEECSLHLAFRWYLGYDLDEQTPDHSVLSKARARYGKGVFEAFFERVVSLCVEAGLVGGDRLFADSTLVAANASVRSVVSRERFFEPLLSPAEHLERVFDENPLDTSDSQDAACNSGTGSSSVGGSTPPVTGEEPTAGDGRGAPPSQADGGAVGDGSCARVKRGRKPKPRRVTNILQVSRTDPDASIITRPGVGTLLAYKEHFTVDSRHRVVTAVEVTPAAHEDYRQALKLLERQPRRPKEFCADSNYGVAEIYSALKRRGIMPVIPRRSPQSRESKPGRIPISAFQYIHERDVYRCPRGEELTRVAYDARFNRYHYRPRPVDCRGCPQRLSCSTAKTVRTIVRYPDQEAIEWALAHYESPRGQHTFSQRCVIAEWVIAEAKGFHGLRRAVCRGLDKMRIQALLIATVQNLKRLMAVTHRHGSLSIRPPSPLHLQQPETA
jgi:transposase